MQNKGLTHCTISLAPRTTFFFGGGVVKMITRGAWKPRKAVHSIRDISGVLSTEGNGKHWGRLPTINKSHQIIKNSQISLYSSFLNHFRRKQKSFTQVWGFSIQALWPSHAAEERWKAGTTRFLWRALCTLLAINCFQGFHYDVANMNRALAFLTCTSRRRESKFLPYCVTAQSHCSQEEGPERQEEWVFWYSKLWAYWC